MREAALAPLGGTGEPSSTVLAPLGGGTGGPSHPYHSVQRIAPMVSGEKSGKTFVESRSGNRARSTSDSTLR